MEDQANKIFKQYPTIDTVYYTNNNFFFNERDAKTFAAISKTEVKEFNKIKKDKK